MITYQIRVEYLGTKFVGWQFQKNGLSIQEVLETALSQYLKENIRVIGSGRTDSGVHASEQSAHFKTKNRINNRGAFINSVNFFLKKSLISSLNLFEHVHTSSYISFKLDLDSIFTIFLF